MNATGTEAMIAFVGFGVHGRSPFHFSPTKEPSCTSFTSTSFTAFGLPLSSRCQRRERFVVTASRSTERVPESGGRQSIYWDDAGSNPGAADPAVDPKIVAEIDALVEAAEMREVDVPPLPKLRNRYLAVRHGQSEANMIGVISSNVEVASKKHGLTGLGRRQARRSATALLDCIGRDNLKRVVIYSSPYRRARETAEEAAKAICNTIQFENEAQPELPPFECPPVLVEPLLRERAFGDLDGKIITTYNYIWPVDLKDAHHTIHKCESVNAVCQRVRELFLKLEAAHEGAVILLFSHADVLQIAQMYMAGVDPRKFSAYRFKNAEVRELLQDPSCLPQPIPMTYN